MHIKRNNDIPLSMADALVALVRRYVLALDPEAKPLDSGIVRSLVPVLAGAGGLSMYVGAAAAHPNGRRGARRRIGQGSRSFALTAPAACA